MEIKLYQAFDKALRICRITAKEIAVPSEVAESSISQFRSGLVYKKGSGDLSVRRFESLVAAAQEIDPRFLKKMVSLWIGEDLNERNLDAKAVAAQLREIANLIEEEKEEKLNAA